MRKPPATLDDDLRQITTVSQKISNQADLTETVRYVYPKPEKLGNTPFRSSGVGMAVSHPSDVPGIGPGPA